MEIARPRPAGLRQLSIGKLKDGSIANQTLPEYARWHGGGSSNNTHIGFEICEDGLTDPAYFSAVYKEAVELCVYLCKLYGLTEKNIICHCEGYKLGIASNHGDVMHWWPKHGKSMDSFRAEVKQACGGTSSQRSREEPAALSRTASEDNPELEHRKVPHQLQKRRQVQAKGFHHR